MSFFVRIILAVLMTTLSACAVNPVTGKQDLALMSEQDEIALGKKTHQQVLQQYRVYDNPALQSYVRLIGNKLADSSHRRQLEYHFTVLDSKEVNAFALPGGYIYITRGLMAYLNSEAELAAVLGHEIGHVTARHSVRQYSAQQLTGISVLLGSLFIPGMEQAGSQLMQTFGAAILRGYGREHELEADKLGAEYLARTNYDPEAMLDVIGVLKDQEVFERDKARDQGREPNVYHGVFATHPDNDTRLQQVVSSAKSLAGEGNVNYLGHEEYMSYIDNLVFGDSPKEGIQRGSDFFHLDLDFAMTFPTGWNVTNKPDRLVMVEPGEKAVLQLFAEKIERSLTPRQFMIERLGLTNLDKESALLINGLDAHTGISVVKTGAGPRPARFTVVYHGNYAFVFAGMTPYAGLMATFDPMFRQTAGSFHQMTAAERDKAQPMTLQVIQADADSSYESLSSQSVLETDSEALLRLLNGHYPDGEPDAGELIKIVR